MKTILTTILLLFSLIVSAQTIEYDSITKKGVVLLETRLELRERHKQERIAFRALPKQERIRLRELEKQQRIYHNSKLTPLEKAIGVVFVGFVFYMTFDEVRIGN